MAVTISRRMTLLLSAGFLLLVAGAGILSLRLATLADEANRLVGSFGKTLRLNQELRERVGGELVAVRRQTEAPQPGFEADLRRRAFAIGARQAAYLTLDIGSEERLALVRARALQDELLLQAQGVANALAEGDRARAHGALARVEETERNLSRRLDLLNTLQLARLDGLLGRLDETARRSVTAAYVLAAFLLAIVAALSILLKSSVIRPLEELLRVSDALRSGDFTVRAPVRRADEVGRLAQGFNFMAASLSESYATLERKVEARTAELGRAQRELRQAEKLSALGQLVGGVAHELNNPLTAVLGFAELHAKELAARGAPEREVEMMRSIVTEAERSRRIVANLLRFARRDEPVRERVRLNELVERTVALRSYEMQTRNVTIASSYDASDPVLAADPHQLQQIVLNLLNNAYDAILETGRPGGIAVATRVAGNGATLEVRDDGPGIREPERVFEPFYTTKPVGKGTGLGLSVCYGIAKEHGGDIAAENTGDGARFRVTLPLADEASPAPAPRPEAPPPRVAAPAAPLRALVVDDEPSVLALEKVYLGKLGIAAVGAGSGDSALSLLSSERFDLVISDARMPGSFDGAGLHGWLREHRPELAGRFLLVSGDAIGLGTGEISLGDVVTLQKPFTFDEYARAVRRVTG